MIKRPKSMPCSSANTASPFALAQVSARVAFHCKVTAGDTFVDALHAPELISGLALERNKLAHNHRKTGQAHGLRQMLFEYETKFLGLLERLDLRANGFLQPFVRDLRDQVFNFSHKLTGVDFVDHGVLTSESRASLE